MITTQEILEHAILGLEHQRRGIVDRIEALQQHLHTKPATRPAPSHAPVSHPRAGTMTPKARRKMSRLLKTRWRQARLAGRTTLGRTATRRR